MHPIDVDGLFIRGAPPRKPWQTWQSPDDANEHGHRHGYVQDPLTGESTRILLAKRVSPMCCYLRVIVLIVTCWVMLLGVIGLFMVAMEISIHLPVWALSLPQFMFHAPATFLLVVYVGIKCRVSLHNHLKTPELVDEIVETELVDEIVEASDEVSEEKIEERAAVVGKEHKGNKTAKENVVTNKEETTTDQFWQAVPKYNSAQYCFLGVNVVVVVLVWAVAAILLGAGVSKFSLRLQQMHATSLGNALLLPASFLHVRDHCNIRNFLSGMWLIDLFFCLNQHGLAFMYQWSQKWSQLEKMQLVDNPKKEIKLAKRELQQKFQVSSLEQLNQSIRFKLMKELLQSVGLVALCVGGCGGGLLGYLELSLSSGMYIVVVLYATVAYCASLALRHAYSYKKSIVSTMIAFHNRLRDKMYRSGIKLRALERDY